MGPAGVLSGASTGFRPWAVIAVISVTQFMVVMDFSIINVALPAIRGQLGATAAEAQWVVGAYALCFCGFLLLGGRMADAYGRSRVFCWAVLAFAVAAGIGGFATSASALILARGVQGMAEAIITPAALSILVYVFDEGPARNRALAIFGGATGLAVVSGVVLGGVLTDLLSWRWTMFINVPIGMFALIGAIIVLPRLAPLPVASLDVPGTALFTPATILVVLGFTVLPERGAGDALAWVAIVSGLILLLMFVRAERRARDPILPLDFISEQRVWSANLTALIFGGAIGSCVFVLSQYLQTTEMMSPLETGMTFLAQGAAALAAAPAVPYILNRYGFRTTLVLSFVFMALSNLLFFIVVLGDFDHWARFLPGMLINGVGATFGAIGINAAATSGVTGDRQGLAAALINIAQQLGIPVVTAIVIIAATGVAGKPFGVVGAETSFLLIAALSLIGVIVSARLLASPVETAVGRDVLAEKA